MTQSVVDLRAHGQVGPWGQRAAIPDATQTRRKEQVALLLWHNKAVAATMSGAKLPNAHLRRSRDKCPAVTQALTGNRVPCMAIAAGLRRRLATDMSRATTRENLGENKDAKYVL